jgi:hypothetical protein
MEYSQELRTKELLMAEEACGAQNAGLGSAGPLAAGEVAQQSKQVVVDNLRAAHLALEAAMLDHIGRIAHEVNRGYCHAIGDHSQVAWEDAPAWQRDSAVLGVKLHLADPSAGPEASHNSWMAQKIAEGWKWGEEKRPSLKLHPCIVPFDKLPVEQKAKDYIFRAVVLAIATAPDLDVDGSLKRHAAALQANKCSS